MLRLQQDRAESQSDPESEVTSPIFCVLNTEYISPSRASVAPSHLKYLQVTENITSGPSQPPVVPSVAVVLLACLFIFQLS